MINIIQIPAPIALPGDRVEVLNYRRNGEKWEYGKVDAFESVKWTIGAFNDQGRWSYTVTLDRLSAAGNRLRLTVGHGNIRRRT